MKVIYLTVCIQCLPSSTCSTWSASSSSGWTRQFWDVQRLAFKT